MIRRGDVGKRAHCNRGDAGRHMTILPNARQIFAYDGTLHGRRTAEQRAKSKGGREAIILTDTLFLHGQGATRRTPPPSDVRLLNRRLVRVVYN